MLDKIDLLVVCRALYTPHVGALIARAKSLGKRVLYDVDDLVFDDRYAHLVMETLAQPVEEESLQAWLRVDRTIGMHDAPLRWRDYDERLPRREGPRLLRATDLDCSQLSKPGPDRLLLTNPRCEQQGEWARDDQIDIGYFSGTPTHERDFALIEPALVTLLESNPAVRLRIVGFPPRVSCRAVRASHRNTALQDFLNLQRVIGDVEINVVPLKTMSSRTASQS